MPEQGLIGTSYEAAIRKLGDEYVFYMLDSSSPKGIVNFHMSLSRTGANSAVAPPKMKNS